jgi:Tfp pilus assembly protein PilN
MKELEGANMFLTESLSKLKTENNEIQSILDKKR